ncbi:putative FBD-associated F-box protein At1g61330 isoform X2 [Magnolia sinica]|uniref:putative FBD-associated F-box protein At1g61330 isoform X2 n=1 Tax=Magnolia sinica TaxID=86752 RepID=UPI00265B02BF|nr:putative FBD-associated F-box protein At1g61330 isoform X2 [Magnolia sinica]
MEKSDDKISELPEAVLHHILSLMPMKSATRTSILSRRWRDHWKYFSSYTKTLDFGEEFASVQTDEEFTTTVDLYIQQHKGNKMETFRLFFEPGNRYRSDTEKWIEFATMSGVTELDLNFRHYNEYYIGFPEASVPCKPFNLPHCLFNCDSLIHLNLALCDFNCPLNFNGLQALKTLHLRRVHLTSEMLESVVSNCLLLEELNLRECFSLDYIKVSGPNLRLKILIVVARGSPKIEISAPNLQSFHYCGALFYGHSFANFSQLVDVILYSRGYQHKKPEHDYIQILKELAHVKVLTVCNEPLKQIAISAKEKYHTWEELPITFDNLQELQLLLTSTSDKSLSDLYTFFANCFFPSLEKLFIQVQAIEAIEYFDNIAVKETSECIFDKLKLIKITGIMGHRNEMRLVKFLLEKATVLEALILIGQKDSFLQSKFTQIQPLMLLHDQLLSLPKTSLDARIVLCEQSDDDNNLWPTHTEAYSSVEFKL